MDMNPHSIVTDVTIDIDITEAVSIYQEIETLFKAASLDGPDAAKSAYPSLFQLYNGLHVYVNNGNPADQVRIAP